jgi:hypothetical protein
MSEEKDQKPDHEQDLAELAKYARTPGPARDPDFGGSFMRGCGIAVGVVALVFLLIVGACFIQASRW